MPVSDPAKPLMKIMFEAISSGMPPPGRKMYQIVRPILLVLGPIVLVAGTSSPAAAKSTVTSVRIGDYTSKTRIVLDLSNKVSFGLQDKPFSAFTYYILEGLKSNIETVDDQGCVTPEKLSVYV